MKAGNSCAAVTGYDFPIANLELAPGEGGKKVGHKKARSQESEHFPDLFLIRAAACAGQRVKTSSQKRSNGSAISSLRNSVPRFFPRSFGFVFSRGLSSTTDKIIKTKPFRGSDGLILSALAVAAISNPANAEYSPEQSARASQLLSEVVVTATRSDTERWKTASSITVIDRSHFESRQQRMITDALRDVPGLTIADRGTAGSTAGIFLRGMKSEQTLVVLNGRPIPANLAGTFNVETFSLDCVERIEVLRGPASSVYGGRTLGGVINILTRSGRNLAKPEFQAFWETGSFGTNREGISARGDSGLLDWSVEYNRSDTQGYRVNSQMQLDNASGLLGFDLSDTVRLDVDFRFYNAVVGVPGASTGFGANDPDNHLVNEFWSVSPRLIWKTSETWTQSFTMQIGNFRQVASNWDPTWGLNNRATARTQYWEYQSVFKPSEKWTFTHGVSLQDGGYSRSSDKGNPRPESYYDIDQNETNWAVFQQLGFEIVKDLHFTGGLRHDQYSDFSDATTWRSGLSWKIPGAGTILHANYGTAFTPASPQDREPAFKEDPSLPNPNLLTPEKSRGFEFGIEQSFSENTLVFGVTAFRNDIRNLIEIDRSLYVRTFMSSPIQIKKAMTQGLEAIFKWEPCRALGLQGSYTYLDAENQSDAVRLVRRPRHQISGDLWIRPVDRLRVGLGLLYSIDREDGFITDQADLEDYMRIRATASFSLSKYSDIFARVENLLGERYQEVRGYPAPRTGVYAGIKVKF